MEHLLYVTDLCYFILLKLFELSSVTWYQYTTPVYTEGNSITFIQIRNLYHLAQDVVGVNKIKFIYVTDDQVPVPLKVNLMTFTKSHDL